MNDEEIAARERKLEIDRIKTEQAEEYVTQFWGWLPEAYEMDVGFTRGRRLDLVGFAKWLSEPERERNRERVEKDE